MDALCNLFLPANSSWIFSGLTPLAVDMVVVVFSVSFHPIFFFNLIISASTTRTIVFQSRNMVVSAADPKVMLYASSRPLPSIPACDYDVVISMISFDSVNLFGCKHNFSSDWPTSVAQAGQSAVIPKDAFLRVNEDT